MKPVQIEDSNLTMTAPPGMEDSVQAIRAYRGQYDDGTPFVATMWEPNEDERLALLAGFPIVISILGTGMPPIKVDVGVDCNRITGPVR